MSDTHHSSIHNSIIDNRDIFPISNNNKRKYVTHTFRPRTSMEGTLLLICITVFLILIIYYLCIK